MLKKISTFIVASILATVSLAGAETLVNGAGATFPYPLYSKWFSGALLILAGLYIGIVNF